MVCILIANICSVSTYKPFDSHPSSTNLSLEYIRQNNWDKWEYMRMRMHRNGTKPTAMTTWTNVVKMLWKWWSKTKLEMVRCKNAIFELSLRFFFWSLASVQTTILLQTFSRPHYEAKKNLVVWSTLRHNFSLYTDVFAFANSLYSSRNTFNVNNEQQ